MDTLGFLLLIIMSGILLYLIDIPSYLKARKIEALKEQLSNLKKRRGTLILIDPSVREEIRVLTKEIQKLEL